MCAFTKIKVIAFRNDDDRKSAMKTQRICGNKNRKISDWKQNSNYNILDLSM